MSTKPDHWNSSAYTSAASFVPQLASAVVQLLAPKPGEAILDIGCGDGVLTADLARAVGKDGHILGLDSSASMIATAAGTADSNTTYSVRDCASVGSDEGVQSRKWDAVFSNAALHWILKSEVAQKGLFKECFDVLKPGGRLAFEMGGKGNVDEVYAAFLAAMAIHGVPLEKARASMPWFFPSDVWMQQTLEAAGFEVKECQLVYRPTKLNPENADGSGGLQGWLRLMLAGPLTTVEEGKREPVIRTVCDLLQDIITREEDGTQWIGYVRLRALAVKP